jgi:hypothetical protein
MAGACERFVPDPGGRIHEAVLKDRREEAAARWRARWAARREVAGRPDAAGLYLALAPMDGVTDAVYRGLLTAIEGAQRDLGVRVGVRAVTRDPVPAAVLRRDVPELMTGGRTAAGVPVFVQLLGGDAEPVARRRRWPRVWGAGDRPQLRVPGEDGEQPRRRGDPIKISGEDRADRGAHAGAGAGGDPRDDEDAGRVGLGRGDREVARGGRGWRGRVDHDARAHAVAAVQAAGGVGRAGAGACGGPHPGGRERRRVRGQRRPRLRGRELLRGVHDRSRGDGPAVGVRGDPPGRRRGD